MASIPRIGEDDAYDEKEGLHPVWLASNYLRRRKYDECVAICTDILAKNPYDQVRATSTTVRVPFSSPSDRPPRSPPPGRVVPEVPRADAEELDRRRRGGGRGTTTGPGRTPPAREIPRTPGSLSKLNGKTKIRDKSFFL